MEVGSQESEDRSRESEVKRPLPKCFMKQSWLPSRLDNLSIDSLGVYTLLPNYQFTAELCSIKTVYHLNPTALDKGKVKGRWKSEVRSRKMEVGSPKSEDGRRERKA